MYAALLLAFSGCDPTRGLADTADAALPDQKRYFDGPGSSLVDGPWNRVVVDLDPDTLYHVGARRLDDKQPTFHLFGADAQAGCEVTPNAGTWLMGKSEAAPFRLLPFLESIDDRGRGRLRFTTLDCQVQDLAIEDAGRPYPRVYDHGYLVPTKHGYTFADPWAGKSHELAQNLERVLVWKDSVLLWADDQLKSFSDQFEPGSTWGNAPESVVAIQDAFLVEDADGLHRVTLDHDTLEIEHEDVLGDACHLQHSWSAANDDRGSWVVLQRPCGNPHPTLLHLDSETFEVLDTIDAPLELEAQQARALLGDEPLGVPGSAGAPNADSSTLSLAYLTDIDDDELGTLWAWQVGSDAPIRLGDRAGLDGVSLAAPDSGWAGAAQVNFQPLGSYTGHDVIRFHWDGTTETIVEHAVQNTSSGELLVNFDGVAGDLPQFNDHSYRVIAKAVPPDSGTIGSYTGARHFARIDHFDGTTGRLLLGVEAADPSTWSPLADGVAPSSPRFSWFMPALLFIDDWDPDSKTGSLVAYNYELDARTTIATNVSSFDMTSYPWEGVVYSVPTGKKRGIWFSKAK